MSGRFQPEHGADSAEAWNPTSYRVLIESVWEPGDRRWVTIPAAIGPNDARSQARDAFPGWIPLREEATT